MPDYIYFEVEWAIREHDKILALTGGRSGIVHLNLIESALAFIRHEDYYPGLADKLTHLVFSFVKNHCFTDGNKRSAIAIGAYFLEVNGFEKLVPRFIVEMENIVVWTAEDLISKDELCSIIDDIIRHGEVTEENKLILINALRGHLELEAERRLEETNDASM